MKDALWTAFAVWCVAFPCISITTLLYGEIKDGQPLPSKMFRDVMIESFFFSVMFALAAFGLRLLWGTLFNP